MTPAIYSRMLQFRAGPNEKRFYACERHFSNLFNADVDLFFGLPKDRIQSEDPDDEQECWWCRGEDGP